MSYTILSTRSPFLMNIVFVGSTAECTAVTKMLAKDSSRLEASEFFHTVLLVSISVWFPVAENAPLPVGHLTIMYI